MSKFVQVLKEIIMNGGAKFQALSLGKQIAISLISVSLVAGAGTGIYYVASNSSDNAKVTNSENEDNDDMIGSIVADDSDPKSDDEEKLDELEKKAESGEITPEEFNDEVNKLQEGGNVSLGQIEDAKQRVASSTPSQGGSTSAPSTPSQGGSTPAPSAPSQGGSTPAPSAPSQGGSTPAPSTPSQGGSTPAPSTPSHKAAGIDGSLTEQLNNWVVSTYAETGLPRYSEVVGVCKNILINGASLPDWLVNGYEGSNGMGYKCFGTNNATIITSENGDLSARALILNSGLMNNSTVYVGGHAQSNIYYISAKHDGNGNLVISMEQLYVGRTY